MKSIGRPGQTGVLVWPLVAMKQRIVEQEHDPVLILLHRIMAKAVLVQLLKRLSALIFRPSALQASYLHTFYNRSLNIAGIPLLDVSSSRNIN